MSVGIGIIGRERILNVGGQTLVGVQTKGMTINNEILDTTDDAASGWIEKLAVVGSKSVSFSIEGLLKNLELVQSGLLGTSSSQIFSITYTWPDGSVMAGDFALVTIDESGSNNELTTFSSSWESSGEVTFTAGV